ncbi:MAG: hypothetical protein CME70_01610 [Halobacteriovorax sp.]|nr:hypothetical protein [Halobacteriovorax sp.]|tara:strand:- start:1295 stop:1558 length:264 start_codon:yes stop_codon:yes gene_type:complete
MTNKVISERERDAKIEAIEALLLFEDPMKATTHCINTIVETLASEGIDARTDIIPGKLNYDEVLTALLLGRDAIRWKEWKNGMREYY